MLSAITTYLDMLWPDPPAGWLVASARTLQGLLSSWHDPAAMPHLAGQLAMQAATQDVYLGLGLRDLGCQPGPSRRGGSDDVAALPGIWLECDHRGGQHANPLGYPSQAELRLFIDTLPAPPTMLVSSGGGYHLYWLFREAWLLDTPAERARAEALLYHLQRTVQAWASAQGWLIDSTHDLARVLRPAGTWNHKSGTPVPVELVWHDRPRYEPSELEEAAWLDTSSPAFYAPPGQAPGPQQPGAWLPGPLAPVVQGCAWLQHCWDDAATLPEPEWYAMLGIVGRCIDGDTLTQDWSAPHPGYAPDATARKLAHALQHGPYTCQVIEQAKGGAPYCQNCTHRGQIRSPITLSGGKPVGGITLGLPATPPPPGMPPGWTPAPAPPAYAPPLVTDLADMLGRTYPPPVWLVHEMLAAGLVFFSGSPKSSKTYFAYELALALARNAGQGSKWLEQYDILLPGPVVYISLEDDEADSAERIRQLAPGLSAIERERLLFVHGFSLPRLGEGLLEMIEQEFLQRYHPSLLVIDPLSYLYAPIKKSGDQFSEVKDMLLPLRWAGKQHGCCIVGIDHRRKKSADDVDIFETQYGSNAKIAVADGLFIIERQGIEVNIHARIRKGPDQTIGLRFEFAADGTARWLWVGASAGVVAQGQYGDLRQRTLDAVKTLGRAVGVDDILHEIGIPISAATKANLRQLLHRMEKAGEVIKTSRGLYAWTPGP